MKKIRRSITYANVVATLALFVALGTGSAYAITQLTGASIKDGSLTGSDIRNGSVGSADIADGKLTGTDLAAGTVTSNDIKNGGISGLDVAFNAITGSHIPTGSIGGSDIADGSVDEADIENGSVGSTEIANDAIDETKISDDAKADIQLGSVPSGQTIVGFFGGRTIPASAGYMQTFVSFPMPAPTALLDSQVNLAGSGHPYTGISIDADATCTGTFQIPTAPSGKVCIYPAYIDGGVDELRGYAGVDGTGADFNRYGFVVDFHGTSTNPTGVRGTWAYQAP